MSSETKEKYGKLHKKAKVAIGRTKNSNNGVGNLDSVRKSFREEKKGQGRARRGVDDVPYADQGKLNSKRNGGKWAMNSKTKRDDEGHYKARNSGDGDSKLVNSYGKRKRVYADQVEKPHRKASAEFGRNKVKEDFVKEKVVDGNGNGAAKQGNRSRSDSRNQSNQNQVRHPFQFSEKFIKNKAQGKKNLVDDSEVINDRPKKKKRVIRIDPNDMTNKRIDDGVALNDKPKKKKEELENDKNAEMSKNAQFRAIKPSPSILSFVEDNLLGRRREIELRRAGYNTDISAPLDNIPFSTSTERERIEEPVFRNYLTFFAAAKISSSLPPPELPEIAFAGRSNVGKSSLLNSLTRQWGVVRTSDKPGLTQSINFFKLGPKLCLVDLPGYGFAYAKEEVKEAWEDLVKEYVSTRVGLKQVCLLIDTKWGMKPRDHELIDLMERHQTKYQIVLTKTDLVFPIDVARRAMEIEESLKAKKSAVQPLMMVSSKSGAGIRSFRTVLSKIARFAKL